MGLAPNISVKVEGLDATLSYIGQLQPEIKQQTLPVMKKATQTLRAKARSNVNTAHPSNYFRASDGTRLSPSYRTRQKGTYWFQVYTPGGDAGAREAQAEFAHKYYSKSGRALVKQLTSVYGRSGGSGNGRILWAAYDTLQTQLVGELQQAVYDAAAAISEGMNNNG